MRKLLYPLVTLVAAALVIGQAATSRTAAAPAAAAIAAAPAAANAAATAAAQPIDYYALATEDFFKRPEVQQRIGKTTFNLTLLEAAIFHQTNRERVNNKLPIFKHGMAMNLMARRHSTEMADLQFFDHVSPNPNNATLGDRLRNVGLVNVLAGENIAVLPAMEIGSGHYITHDALDGKEVWLDEATGKPRLYYTYQDLAAAVSTKWMNSPHHHDNIVKKEYVYLGVGVARGAYDADKQDSFYMTQNFCGSITPETEAKAKTGLVPKP